MHKKCNRWENVFAQNISAKKGKETASTILTLSVEVHFQWLYVLNGKLNILIIIVLSYYRNPHSKIKGASVFRCSMIEAMIRWLVVDGKSNDELVQTKARCTICTLYLHYVFTRGSATAATSGARPASLSLSISKHRTAVLRLKPRPQQGRHNLRMRMAHWLAHPRPLIGHSEKQS